MRVGIRTKLLLSFTAVILIMSVIAVAFITLFADKYIIDEANRQLKDYADRIILATVGQQLNPSAEETLRDILAQIEERNYSVALFDENDSYSTGFRMDSLGISQEEFSKEMKSRLAYSGSTVLRHGTSVFAVYNRPVMNMVSGRKICSIVLVMQIDTYRIDSALFMFFITSLVFAAMFAVPFSVLFSNTLTTNLKKLQHRADMLAHRQFEAPIRIRSNDEVGDLARSIDVMAESIVEYDKSQKLFLQNASHELKTPLMSIQGYVEGLRDGVFDDTAKTCDTILAQTKRLERIIEDVLYLSKIETTQEILDEKPVDAEEIADEALSRVGGIAAAANINLIKGNFEKTDVYADTDRMATALTNILSNCIRFASSYVRMDICVSEAMVCFVVQDDGTGIDEQDLPHLFERFYKGKKGKHGLGLAIAKAIVTQHKGTITAYDRADGVSGAVFDIRIPIAAKPAE